MKSRIYFALATFVLITMCTASAARAQSPALMSLVANVPFEFEVGKAKLPAGKYLVREIVEASQGAVLQLINKDDKSARALMTISTTGKNEERARLVFHRYGNHYFFAEAWSTESTGWQAPKSRAERAIEREYARLNQQMKQIALFAHNQ